MLLYALGFLVSTLGLTLSYELFLSMKRRKVLAARIRDIRNPSRDWKNPSQSSDLELELSFQDRLTSLLKGLWFFKRVSGVLLQANSTLSLLGLLLVSAGSGTALGVVVGMSTLQVKYGCAAFVFGCCAPSLWYRHIGSVRLKRASEVLPETMDLISRALRSGHSIIQALEVVSTTSAEPLASEFAQVLQQQRLGLPLRDTLLHLGERLPSREIQFLVTAVLVQRETGGDLAEVLDRTALVLRERLRVRGEVRILTAQGRFTGWVLTTLPMALLLLMNMLSPNYARVLFTDPLGQKGVFCAVGLIAIGASVIQRMIKVRF